MEEEGEQKEARKRKNENEQTKARKPKNDKTGASKETNPFANACLEMALARAASNGLAMVRPPLQGARRAISHGEGFGAGTPKGAKERHIAEDTL